MNDTNTYFEMISRIRIRLLVQLFSGLQPENRMSCWSSRGGDTVVELLTRRDEVVISVCHSISCQL